MADTARWEAFLAEHFLGYLLPEATGRALPLPAATRFLEAISGQARQLFLLRATSALSPRVEALNELCLRQLPLLSRSLLMHAEVDRRAWEGRVEGKLDVPATLQRRFGGRPTEFVARARVRRRDLPEDVLVKAVSLRLVRMLEALRALGVVSESGWSATLPACERALTHVLTSTALRAVADAPITAAHEAAARSAHHPAYALALDFYRALTEGLDSKDPEAIARVVAEGALAPLAEPTRFELAVLVRLIQALEQGLARRAPGRWTLHRTLIRQGRRDIAELARDDGASVQVFYNQACLEPGPYDLGLLRYLGQRGRLRPDITVITRAVGAPLRAAVIEAKLSSDPGYLAEGYREALLYRAAYAAELTGWPKAILVASSKAMGAPQREDEVIAVGWEQWVPESVVEGLIEGV